MGEVAQGDLIKGIRAQLCPAEPAPSQRPWELTGPAPACRDLLHDWYINQLDECKSSELLGSMHYSNVDQIPRLLFGGEVDGHGVGSASTCHPGCGALHPSVKGGNDKCCGSEQYKCGIGEGRCSVDSDCAGDLTCGLGNCLWYGADPQDRCCQAQNYDELIQALRLVALEKDQKDSTNLAAESEAQL